MPDYVCQVITKPLDATVTLPGSKSITNRALIASALADGTGLLRGILLAEDTRLMVEALRALGVAISVDEATCVAEVTGCRGHLPIDEADLFCGNAGTVMRFGTALATLGDVEIRLDGTPRMRERPIGALVDALRTLGAGFEYLGEEGFPPLAVHASGLRGGQVTFDSSPSSQFISAVLLVAPYARRDVMIEVEGTRPSLPYLKMTTAVMQSFGVTVLEQYDPLAAKLVIAAPQRYAATTYHVEPDASNASYFLAAAAVAGGHVTVEGLGTDSIQGDARFVDVLESMGCRVERSAHALTLFGPADGERLRGVDVDLGDMPDMVQTLAVAALFANGSTTIRNVASLRIKETDRLEALRRELTKLGAKVEVSTDGLLVAPPEKLLATAIDTYDDHRMAMSFALAGLRCPGLVIRDAECCGKTFPDFFDRWDQMTDRDSC